MGIKGEPATPVDPAQGLVWRAILTQVDQTDSESLYVSVVDTARATLAKHPWSLGGGGAAALKDAIEKGQLKLKSISASIGITSFTLEDDAFIPDRATYARAHVPASLLRDMVIGDELRDWRRGSGSLTLFPYTSDFKVQWLPG